MTRGKELLYGNQILGNRGQSWAKGRPKNGWWEHTQKATNQAAGGLLEEKYMKVSACVISIGF